MNKTIWTFYDFVSPAGINQITEWYKGLQIQEQSDFDAFLKFISKQERWDRRDYRPLHGKCKGLGELCFKSLKKQHRVLGQFGIQGPRYQYILLIGCTHKQQIYDPPNAMDTALQRKKLLESSAGKVIEHDTQTY